LNAATAVQVTNYNNVAGDNFLAYFVYNAPTGAVQRSGVFGLVVPD
jgi:hypothetical protein